MGVPVSALSKAACAKNWGQPSIFAAGWFGRNGLGCREHRMTVSIFRPTTSRLEMRSGPARLRIWMTRACVAVIFAVWFPAVVPGQNSVEPIEFFEKQIRPVLVEKCYLCHSAKTTAMADLLLDSKQGLLKGGSRGPAIVPGEPEKSLLLTAISYKNLDLKMPPTGKLSDEEWNEMRRHPLYGADILKDSDNELLKMSARMHLWWPSCRSTSGGV